MGSQLGRRDPNSTSNHGKRCTRSLLTRRCPTTDTKTIQATGKAWIRSCTGLDVKEPRMGHIPIGNQASLIPLLTDVLAHLPETFLPHRELGFPKCLLLPFTAQDYPLLSNYPFFLGPPMHMWWRLFSTLGIDSLVPPTTKQYFKHTISIYL